MATLKTQPTTQSVVGFINAIEHKQRKADSLALLAIYQEITGQNAVLWGDSLIGFGCYQYTNTAGVARWPVTAFSPRKQSLTLYFMLGFSQYSDYLARLGKAKTSKSCLYINKLADVDLAVLKELIAVSINDMHKKYNCVAADNCADVDNSHHEQT